MSQTYAGSDHTGTDIYQVTGISLRSFHDWAYIVGPNFWGSTPSFTATYFLKTELVPKLLFPDRISSSVLIFFAGILEIAGFITQVSVVGMIFALPIFMYEMTLAVLLISKGFNKRSALLHSNNILLSRNIDNQVISNSQHNHINRKMKAFIKTKYGGPEILSLQDVESPLLQEDQLLVKVMANSANRQTGTYFG
ncbi:MAG: DUF4386 family protein [Saprospiraceae bacterium]